MAVVLVLLTIPASATTITASNSDLASLTFNTAVYRVVATNGGELPPGQNRGFIAPSTGATVTLTGTSTLVLSGYSIPSGAALNAATLDLAALLPSLGTLTFPMTGSGGTVGTWRPTFVPTPSAGYLTVTSGGHSVTASSGLDLIAAGFSAQLLAGDAFDITWSQAISIAGSNAGYDKRGTTGWQNATRDFDLSQTISTTASGTLHIDYSLGASPHGPAGPGAVPEPASCFLMGAGLFLLWRFRK